MQMLKWTSLASLITAARGTWAGFALVLLGGIAASPAYAVSFTDIYGRTCDTSQLGTNPVDPSGPSICPNSSGPVLAPLSKTYKLSRGGLTWNIHGGEPFDDLTASILTGLPAAAPTFNQLGMSVTPQSAYGNGVAFGAGGFNAHSSGVRVTDTAGFLAPGTTSIGSQTNAGSGGISGSYDASRMVGSNQSLVLNGAFDYTSMKTNFGAAVSSINSDTYSFTGSALYRNHDNYLILKGSYEFGNHSEFFIGDGSRGNYRSDGYDVDARIGHVFMLYNSIAAVEPPPRMSVKAPPRATDGGYAVGIDLSGHLGYASNVAGGFTDTSGFVFGDERTQSGDTGLRAKLVVEIPRNGVVWQPYISGSVDWLFGYSHVAYFPTQAALAGGDAVSFSDATTFVGAQIGLDVKSKNGWTVGVNAFYSHSSDTEVAGGRAYVKIPFGPTTVVARY